MSGFQEFSFGQNDENIGNKGKRAKFEEGKTYRVSFVWWEGLDADKPEMGDADNPVAPKFVGAPIHYIQGVGYVVNKGPEYTKLAGSPPKTRVATAVIMWPTDKMGDVDKSRLMGGEAEVMPWVFSADKYKSLQQIHKEFNFGMHDITITCTEAKFQKLTFSPCKENLLRKLMESDKAKELVTKMIDAAKQVVSSIQGEVGREMTIEQVKDKLAGGTGATAGGGGATAPSTATTGEIDDLVDDLLD